MVKQNIFFFERINRVGGANCRDTLRALPKVNQTMFGILSTSTTFSNATYDMYGYMFKLNKIQKFPSLAQFKNPDKPRYNKITDSRIANI